MKENIHPQPTNINELGAELPPATEIAQPAFAAEAQQIPDAAATAEATLPVPEHVAKYRTALGAVGIDATGLKPHTFRASEGLLGPIAAKLDGNRNRGTFDRLKKVREARAVSTAPSETDQTS